MANLKAAGVPETAKGLLPELVAASKKTVADNQANINKQGVGYKGFTPAHFGTQAAAEFSAKTGIYLKQTTQDGLLRNPKNKADEFEAGLLAKLADASYPRQGDKAMSETVEGGKAVQVMLPLSIMEKAAWVVTGHRRARRMSLAIRKRVQTKEISEERSA